MSRYPSYPHPAPAHLLWRGEVNAREAARKYLVENRKLTITDDEIAVLVEIIYPHVASGVLSKAMDHMLNLGMRHHVHETIEALDLIRRRWTGPGARSRP